MNTRSTKEHRRNEIDSGHRLVDADRLGQVIEYAGRQLLETAGKLNAGVYPRSVLGTEWKTESASGHGWIQGYFPGCLWLMYELTGDEKYLCEAEARTAPLEKYKANAHLNIEPHCIAYILLTSYGNGFRLRGNESYRHVLLAGARSLDFRYVDQDNLKCYDMIEWGEFKDDSDKYPDAADKVAVNADSMVSMELVFFSSANGGDAKHREMALNHLMRASKVIIKPDGCTYQVSGSSRRTGELEFHRSHQGYTDKATGRVGTWSRGLSWCLHGYVVGYRYTLDPQLLELAQRIADYHIANAPDDFIPYYDYEDPDIPNVEKDAAAAASIAAALFELSTFVADINLKTKYWNAAVDLLNSLSVAPYFSEGSGTPGLIMRCCEHRNNDKGNFLKDTTLIYADYYYLLALTRYISILSIGHVNYGQERYGHKPFID